jgi:hypothetical protein
MGSFTDRPFVMGGDIGSDKPAWRLQDKIAILKSKEPQGIEPARANRWIPSAKNTPHPVPIVRWLDTSRFSLLPHEAGFDPIEERLRMNVRATIEAVFEEELALFLGRLRYGRGDGAAKGYRHGHRERQLTGTFGTETVRVPRARIEDETGKVTEWRSNALPRYQRF